MDLEPHNISLFTISFHNFSLSKIEKFKEDPSSNCVTRLGRRCMKKKMLQYVLIEYTHIDANIHAVLSFPLLNTFHYFLSFVSFLTKFHYFFLTSSSMFSIALFCLPLGLPLLFFPTGLAFQIFFICLSSPVGNMCLSHISFLSSICRLTS